MSGCNSFLCVVVLLSIVYSSGLYSRFYKRERDQEYNVQLRDKESGGNISVGKMTQPSLPETQKSDKMYYPQDRKTCTTDIDCPPWTYCNNNSYCECNENLHEDNTVKCDNYTLQLSIHRCHCLTFDNKTGEIVEGLCFENCVISGQKKYLPLPLNVSSLNKLMCEENWNRTGRLCGKCLPGYSPLAYTYEKRCVKCPEGNRNIWKYTLAAFGPLTVFYFILLFFKINVTSSHLHGYLLFSQFISIPTIFQLAVLTQQNNSTNKVFLRVMGAFYSIWNLDILTGVYPDICLDVSTLTVLALDYAVATYPLVLILLSYFLIQLHDRNFKVVVFLWKPFRCVFTLFRRNWDSRTTVIDAYTTFFLLSVIKILNVSADLLIPVKAHNIQNETFTWALFQDGTIDYFGSEHLPYAIPAILFCLTFVILPTVFLMLYPFRWFQRLLGCLNIRWHILHAVMDSFQGCYKNGTEPGTRDCRWFAAVPLIERLILFILYIVTLDSTNYPLAIVTLIIFLIVTITVQPYKNNRYTIIDATFLGLLAILYATVDGFVTVVDKKLLTTINTIGLLSAIFPLLYMTCIAMYWILTRMRKAKELYVRVKAWKRGYYQIEDDFEASLPHRLANPEQYQGENIQEPIADNNETLNNTRDTY